MKEIEIKEFEDLISYVKKCEKRSTLFRGVKSVDYQLIPSIGRRKFRGKFESREKRILNLFIESSLPYLDYTPQNKWEWIALGQHHGLPTRLLDWSANPLIAAYFAVQDSFEGDSAIYVLFERATVDTKANPDPFKYNKVERYRPPHLTQRIITQNGFFTIHPNPQEPLISDKVEKLIIKNKSRKNFKHLLYKFGISNKFIFPGLDGIAADIDWVNTIAY